MTDRTSLLERYRGRTLDQRGGDLSEPAAAADGEMAVEAFAWLRGIRDRALMLELRKKDGTIMGIGYSWIERVEFDPSTGITLHAGGRRITIKGRNLNAQHEGGMCLLAGILRHRITWIHEASEANRLCSETDVTLVETLQW